MQLSTKMTLFNLLSKGGFLLFFLISGPYLLKFFALQYTDSQLIKQKELVLQIIADEGIESFFEESETGYGSYNLLKEEYISLEKTEALALRDTIVNEERILDDNIVLYRVLSSSFIRSDHYYLLEIGRSLETINRIEKVMLRFILVAFLIFITVSVVLDGYVHKRILTPLYQIVYAKLPEIKNFQVYSSKPINSSTKDFTLLDEAIDNLIIRLRQAYDHEREFIAHASHELITPISVLQSKIENLVSEGNLYENELLRLLDMQKTIQQVKHLINSLLLISKIDNAQFIKNDVVSLNELLSEIYEEWRPIAHDKGIAFELSGCDPQNLTTNRSLVMVLIKNAVTNAIRNTPGNGKITISGNTLNSGYSVFVEDTGNGIPASVLEQVKAGKVFLKDATSEKSGFGLQIMHKIANFLNVKLSINSTSTGTKIEFLFSNLS
jgi:signal transduction histidine kinase